MARTGEYHRFHISAYLSPTGKTTEQVSDGWNVRGEAKDFLRMVLNGQITVEQVRIDILMTDKQEAYLLRHKLCEPPAMLQRIKWKREWTWKVFATMYQQAVGGAVAA